MLSASTDLTLIKNIKDTRLAVIGLGYVGLPLLVGFAKKFPCIGFNIQQRRVDELKQGIDVTLELSPEELKVVRPPLLPIWRRCARPMSTL